jgi:hypothetical protein
LIHLELPDNPIISKYALSTLPSSLETLILYAIAAGGKVAAASVSRLQLRVLHVETLVLEEREIEILPSSLTSLKVSKVEGMASTGVNSLPRNLTCLNLGRTQYMPCSVAFSFPPALQEIHITSDGELLQVIVGLPTATLRKLDLSGCKKSTEKFDFGTFPPNLESLVLPEGDDIFYEEMDVKRLPKSLKHLSISQFGAASYALLPPELETLDTRNPFSEYKGNDPLLSGKIWRISFRYVGTLYRCPTIGRAYYRDWETYLGLFKSKDEAFTMLLIEKHGDFEAMIASAFYSDASLPLRLLRMQGKILCDVGGAESTSMVVWAVKSNCITILEFLVFECNASLSDAEKSTVEGKLLHLALGRGNYKVCEFLMRNGRNPFDLDSMGHTAIYVAVTFRDIEALLFLKDNWTKITSWLTVPVETWLEALHLQTSPGGYDALQLAFYEGKEEVYHWLMQEGMSTDTPAFGLREKKD